FQVAGSVRTGSMVLAPHPAPSPDKELTMGFLGFLIVGLICGTLAKAILKDRAVGGWLASLIIGVVGAFVGGWLGGLTFDVGLGSFWDIKTWLLALVGAIGVLFVYTALPGNRATARWADPRPAGPRRPTPVRYRS